MNTDHEKRQCASLQVDTPLVSVIISSYNHAQYVREALMSVQAQTYPNIELIIIDDGSTDETAQIIEQTLSTFDRDLGQRLLPQRAECQGFSLAQKLPHPPDPAAALLPNPIERLWTVMHQHVTHKRAYHTQKLFTEANLKFFHKIIPEQWHNFQNQVTNNFSHHIRTKYLGFGVSGVYDKENQLI